MTKDAKHRSPKTQSLPSPIDENISSADFLDYIDARLASVPRVPRRRMSRCAPSVPSPPAHVGELPQSQRDNSVQEWITENTYRSRPFEYLGEEEFTKPLGRFPRIDDKFIELQNKFKDLSPASQFPTLEKFRWEIWSACNNGAVIAEWSVASSASIDDVRHLDTVLAEVEGLVGIFSEIDPRWWARFIESGNFARPNRVETLQGQNLWRITQSVGINAFRLRRALGQLREVYSTVAGKQTGRPFDYRTADTIDCLAKVWTKLTGKKASGSLGGPFARFAAAAWADMEVIGYDKSDFESWIYAEIDRRIKGKKPSKKWSS